jgi:hypothetical protein
MTQNRKLVDRSELGRWWILATLIVVVAIALGVGTSASAQPVARVARSCSVPKYPGLGYFTSLSVTNTSCTTGRELVFAYYHCRLRRGKAGTCHSTMLGFSCREQRRSIPTEIDARVTCRRGGATVIHTYQQDT